MAVKCCRCGSEKKWLGKTFFQCPSCRRVFCHECMESGFLSGKCPDCGGKIRSSDKV